MTITLDRQVDLVTAQPIASTVRPAVLVRQDGTILTAWEDTLWHLSGDGDILGQAIIPDLDRYPILAPTSDPGRSLLLDGTTARVIDETGTVASSQPAPGPNTAAFRFMAAPMVLGDLTVVVADGGVYIYTASGTHAGTWPLPGIYPVAAWPHGGHVILLTLDGGVWSVIPSGATQVGTVDTAGFTAIGGTDPTAGEPVLLASEGPPGARLIKGGVTVAEDGHADLDRLDMGHTTATQAGMVTASEWSTDPAFEPSSILFHYYTQAGDLHDVRVDLPYRQQGASAIAGSLPVTSHHGGRVAVIHHLVDVAAGTGSDIRYLILWLLTVPHEADTYHGVLHIDTLTHPYWLVGTADPDMDYRLHIDTGTERLVEILAGQDDQATHRLRVCDGTDWPVAAYLRPE